MGYKKKRFLGVTKGEEKNSKGNWNSSEQGQKDLYALKTSFL
jgi:hypothetical protein